MNHQTDTYPGIQENLKVFDFELSDEDVRLIADLRGCVDYASDPEHTNL